MPSSRRGHPERANEKWAGEARRAKLSARGLGAGAWPVSGSGLRQESCNDGPSARPGTDGGRRRGVEDSRLPTRVWPQGINS